MTSPPDFDAAIAIRRKATGLIASSLGVAVIVLVGGYMLRPLDPARMATIAAAAFGWLLVVQQTTRLAVGDCWLMREVVWWGRSRTRWVDLAELASIDVRVSFPFDDLVLSDTHGRSLFLRVGDVQIHDVVSRRLVRALVAASTAGAVVTPRAKLALSKLARSQQVV